MSLWTIPRLMIAKTFADHFGTRSRPLLWRVDAALQRRFFAIDVALVGEVAVAVVEQELPAVRPFIGKIQDRTGVDFTTARRGRSLCHASPVSREGLQQVRHELLLYGVAASKQAGTQHSAEPDDDGDVAEAIPGRIAAFRSARDCHAKNPATGQHSAGRGSPAKLCGDRLKEC